MSGFDAIKIDIDARGTATLRLNRPDKRNALNSEMFAALRGELARLQKDPALRCVVIRGEGTAFCAGADLDEVRAMRTATANETLAAATLARDSLQALYEFPRPTIAMVHGPALAGGCGLATCCDFVVASSEATFGYPEVKIGFIPAIVMVMLTRQVGERAARDLCLSGRTIGADEAFRLGLVHQVTLPDGLDSAVADLAAQLRKNSPAAMATVKQMFAQLPGEGLHSALDWAARMNAQARGTPECQEGIAAFLEKRKPNWL